jgi:putative addiction module CopG family antidote
MQIELTPEQNSFISLGIHEGRFRSTEEAVRQALSQWEKRERARIELLDSLDLAEKSIDAGEGEDHTIESLPALVESIRSRGMASLSDK